MLVVVLAVVIKIDIQVGAMLQKSVYKKKDL
jgi:hypothetical protein